MPATNTEGTRRSNWVTTNSSNIFYRPRNADKESSRARLPRPLIGPRRTRPNSIHIVTYPSGYIPTDLRPTPQSASQAKKEKAKAEKARKKEERKQLGEQEKRQKQLRRLQQREEQLLQQHQQRRLGETLLSTSPTATPVGEIGETRPPARTEAQTTPAAEKRLSFIGKLLDSFSSKTKTSTTISKSHHLRRLSIFSISDTQAPTSTQLSHERDYSRQSYYSPEEQPSTTPTTTTTTTAFADTTATNSTTAHEPTGVPPTPAVSPASDVIRPIAQDTQRTPPSESTDTTATFISGTGTDTTATDHHYPSDRHQVTERRNHYTNEFSGLQRTQSETVPTSIEHHRALALAQLSGPSPVPSRLSTYSTASTVAPASTSLGPSRLSTYSTASAAGPSRHSTYSRAPAAPPASASLLRRATLTAASRCPTRPRPFSLPADMATHITAPPPQLASSPRQSLMSVRSATKSAISPFVTEVPKPVATGSGVTCSILLAEPNIFLSGFDHDSHNHRETQPGGTALLRGRLQLNVSKNVKIKAVQLKLLGRARTEWPEGIPPLKQDLFEEQGLRTQVLTFYNACMDGWETEYGNQCVYKLKSGSANSSSTNLAVRPSPATLSSSRSNLTAKDLKRLSLQNSQSRSFGKGDNPQLSGTQVKGFKVFYPGSYEYSFELPIDHHQLETTKLQYGSVKWELHATVERAGAFKPNLHGIKEVCIVRVPDQMSLEMTEPISISRQWEDQLHYDIIISGKSFPIGSKIPIAFKLTPLAKVQVHKLKVFLTESVEYWTNDRRVTRKDPGRKLLLLEKSAGKPLDSNWASSELRTVRGGELSPDDRRRAREEAARWRAWEAERNSRQAEPLPEPTENLLGDLDLGLESFWGSTEIEANVQIPTCEMMAKNKDLRLNPDCSWKNVNVYHWIKIVMRISRLDPEDPKGKKRRHFEISIDSPFTVLNCRATQANTNLPAYHDTRCNTTMRKHTCGCPDAQITSLDVTPSSSTGTLLGADNALPAMPQAAHLAHTQANPASDTSGTGTPTSEGAGLGIHPRPIHLLRAPSFNPPAFDDDSAPPPLEIIIPNDGTADSIATPPPQYDVVVGTPSVDGLADYFSRLADAGYDDREDSGSSDEDASPPRILERSGRVNVAHPRTPGGRIPSRSLEISRPAVQLRMPTVPNRATTSMQTPAATPAAT